MVNQLPVPVFEAKPSASHLRAFDSDGHLGHEMATLITLAADPIVYGMSQDLMLLCPSHPDHKTRHTLLLCHLVQVAGGCAAASTIDNDIENALVEAVTMGFDHSPAAYAAQIRALCLRIDPLNEWLMYETWHAAAPVPVEPMLLDTALTMVGDAHAKLDTATCIIATFDVGSSIVIENQQFRVQIGSLTFRVVHASAWIGGGASMHISWDANGLSTPTADGLELAAIASPVGQHTRLDGLYRVVLQRVHE